MKDFDRVETGAVRTMSEANHWFDRNKGIAGRREFGRTLLERIRVFFRKTTVQGEGLR